MYSGCLVYLEYFLDWTCQWLVENEYKNSAVVALDKIVDCLCRLGIPLVHYLWLLNCWHLR